MLCILWILYFHLKKGLSPDRRMNLFSRPQRLFTNVKTHVIVYYVMIDWYWKGGGVASLMLSNREQCMDRDLSHWNKWQEPNLSLNLSLYIGFFRDTAASISCPIVYVLILHPLIIATMLQCIVPPQHEWFKTEGLIQSLLFFSEFIWGPSSKDPTSYTVADIQQLQKTKKHWHSMLSTGFDWYFACSHSANKLINEIETK